MSYLLIAVVLTQGTALIWLGDQITCSVLVTVFLLSYLQVYYQRYLRVRTIWTISVCRSRRYFTCLAENTD